MTNDYTIIGSGRLAMHFHHYFDLKKIKYKKWSRNFLPKYNDSSLSDDPDLRLSQTIAHTPKILLLISDQALLSFYLKYEPLLRNKMVIHFSGSLVLENLHSAHPLMTFSKDLYDLETYENAPFVTEQGKFIFPELFPELSNPHKALPPQLKALYHSLCVMSGNFTSLLWEQVLATSEKSLDLPANMFLPYLNQICKNIGNDYQNALTGPLVRRDSDTINRNLDSLSKIPKTTHLNNSQAFRDLYLSFVKFYQNTHPNPTPQETQ